MVVCLSFCTRDASIAHSTHVFTLALSSCRPIPLLLHTKPSHVVLQSLSGQPESANQQGKLGKKQGITPHKRQGNTGNERGARVRVEQLRWFIGCNA